MTAKESLIRDNLAKDLAVLESGLQLIQREYPLNNAIGSKGYIDILARDAFGNRVVIEIKRSNQAARQAIHEIFKYVALFREQQRIPEHRLRCIIVSTEWNELRVPFAELVRSLHLQVQGFSIKVDDAGRILNIAPEVPVELSPQINLFRNHDIYLFEANDTRDQARQKVLIAFEQASGTAGFMLVMDYIGNSEAVIYRHALYLVPVSVAPEAWKEIENEVRVESPDIDLDDAEGQLLMEETFSERMMNQLLGVHDTYEIGYPEKFQSMSDSDWQVVHLVRIGTVPDESAADDGEVVRWISGIEGKSATHFFRVTSPRFHLDWDDTAKNLEYCLRGNPTWSIAVNWFVQLVADSHPNASVSFAIFNPLNFLVSLFKFVGDSSKNYLPGFEIVAWDSERRMGACLLGRLEWDGVTRLTTVDESLGPPLGNIKNLLFATMLHTAWKHDAGIVASHGFSYATAYGILDEKGAFMRPIKLLGDPPDVEPIDVQPGVSVHEFVEQNQRYVTEVTLAIAGMTTDI